MKRPSPALPGIANAPGLAERFRRGLRRTLKPAMQQQTKPLPKAKTRPASKGRVHKGKTRA